MRGPVAECRMKTSLIVPQLDVPGNIFHSPLARRVNSPVDPLDLQCGIERFRETVVKALTGQKRLDRPFGAPVNTP